MEGVSPIVAEGVQGDMTSLYRWVKNYIENHGQGCNPILEEIAKTRLRLSLLSAHVRKLQPIDLVAVEFSLDRDPGSEAREAIDRELDYLRKALEWIELLERRVKEAYKHPL